ncbi:predicted protein [Naegleria gruberi]|uniref:Predicted protein n=1 Tax=Naegleria gruberi TaxID=5762 RepID=D2W6A3_NAEGR|nr:uncharacterized protein NAEGRDRAFT_54940 [Naegleria gruberi]EFC35399.1 predicted protein [Naegleria gruberi]|eukprot:XP_002668143.1 predicted protein [Naegleria gruberi strain NEG-M]
MAPTPTTPKNNKKTKDLSSPSAGSEQRVIVLTPSTSNSSDSSAMPSPPPVQDTKKNKKNNQQKISPGKDSNNAKVGSQGASALASSMELFESNPSEEVSGKRARVADEPDDWFKNHVIDSYQRMFGESLKEDLPLEEAVSLLFETANAPYADNLEFKNRMAALELLFRKEVDTPIPDSSGIKDIKSKGYSLLLTNSFIISQICKRLRESDTLDLPLILQGFEFIQNISELNLVCIRMGIKNGFEAAENFSNSYKSGGSLDQITSKQQEKAIKSAEKVKAVETIEKVSKWASRTPNFHKFPTRYDNLSSTVSVLPSCNKHRKFIYVFNNKS